MLFYFLSLLSKNQSNEITEQSDSTRLDRPVNNNIFGHSWTINHPYTLNSTKEIDYTYTTNDHLFFILGWILKSRVGNTVLAFRTKQSSFTSTENGKKVVVWSRWTLSASVYTDDWMFRMMARCCCRQDYVSGLFISFIRLNFWKHRLIHRLTRIKLVN